MASSCDIDIRCGTGSSSITLPSDPDMHNSVLIAKPAYGAIHLSWTYPEHNSHAVSHTLVYRSRSGDPESRVDLGLTNSSHHVDHIDTPTTYFYWIQFISINGTRGPLIGPASATSLSESEKTAEELTGLIDEGMLAPKLKGIIGAVGDNGNAIAAERYSRIEADGSLSLAFSDLEINLGDVRTALIDTQEEFRSADQALVNTIEGIYAQTEENHGLILEEQTVRATETEALAQALTTVESTLNGNIAQVQTNVQASIEGVEGDVSGLHRDVTGVKRNVNDISASYTTVVNVNGLIGGFGIGNNGETVEAGFDVDRFWVGRTNYDKVKPFIIDDGIAYLDDARIRNASIETLKIADNAVTVPLFSSQGRTQQRLDPGSMSYSGLTVTGWFNTSAPVTIIVTIIASVPDGTSTNSAIAVKDKYGRTAFWASATSGGGWTTTHTFSHQTTTHVSHGYNSWDLYVGNDWSRGWWRVWGASLLILGMQK